MCKKDDQPLTIEVNIIYQKPDPTVLKKIVFGPPPSCVLNKSVPVMDSPPPPRRKTEATDMHEPRNGVDLKPRVYTKEEYLTNGNVGFLVGFIVGILLILIITCL